VELLKDEDDIKIELGSDQSQSPCLILKEETEDDMEGFKYVICCGNTHDPIENASILTESSAKIER